MNEDGNSTMLQNPSFPSPNFSSNDNTTPVETEQSVPERMITSADVQATANTESGVVAAAVASMGETESATPGVIMSAPDNAQSSPRSRMFSSRRFKPNQQQVAPTRFANAPDFFNEAAGANEPFITIGGDEPKARAKINPRFIILGALVGLIAIIGVVSLILQQGGGDQSDKIIAQSRGAWKKTACYILFEKEDGSCDIPSEYHNEKYAPHTTEDYNAYANKAFELIDDYRAEIKDAKGDRKDDITFNLDELEEYIENVRFSLENTTPTDYEVVQVIIDQTYNDSDAYAASKYNGYVGANGKTLRLANWHKIYAKNLFDILKIYQASGCDLWTLDHNPCSVAEYEKLYELIQKNGEMQEKIINTKQQSRSDIVKTIIDNNVTIMEANK